MNTTQSANRIHPLLAVAAVSVTLVSLLGIAAMAGILPNSHGSTTDAPRSAVQSAPGSTQLASTPSLHTPDAAVRKTMAHQPTFNQTEHALPAASQVAVVDTTQQARPAPAPQQIVAPHNSPLGIGVGAVIGGILGSQVGGGDGKTLATIAGAVGGGYLGNEVAKRNQ